MDIGEIKNQFKSLIDKTENVYSDLNFYSNDSTKIIIDKVNTDVNKSSDSGVKMRVWDGEKFFEHGQTNMGENDLKRSYDNLIKKAKNSEILKKTELKIDKEVIEKDYFSKTQKPIISLDMEEKVKQLNEFKKKILDYSEDIVNVRVILVERDEKNVFVNNYKSLSQNITLATLVLAGFVKSDDGSIRLAFKSFVDNGLEVFDKAQRGFGEFTKDIECMKKAKKLKGGKYQVILSPGLTGLLAHESFGHGMESDTMLKGRALASEWMGKKIGEDFVNIVDYPQIDGVHGQFYFDHEGNSAHKTYLVKDGVINEPMGDLYSKNKMGLENSSNSRFESFDHKNYVRMSNTYFEPGNSSFDELISDIEDGILVTGSSGGMEDPKGWGVQIQGCNGQRIRDGKLVDEYYDGFTFTGFLPDIIKNIEGLSKEFEIEGGGFCGKGHKEWVRVSDGGPYMKIKEVILG